MNAVSELALNHDLAAQTFTFNTTHFTAFSYLDLNPPSSVITNLINNSDLGKNSFPINLSGTALDNINLSYVNLNIGCVKFNDKQTYWRELMMMNVSTL